MDANESDVYLSLTLINVIDRQGINSNHRDDLIGAAIMLLLKRQKINKLVALQTKAQLLYEKYVENMKSSTGREDPIFSFPILLSPTPDLEFLNNGGEIDKCNLTLVLIPQWWRDNNYYEHLEFVKNALKPVIEPFTEERFFDILEKFFEKRYIGHTIASGIATAESIGEAREKVKEKMENLENDQILTLKPIIKLQPGQTQKDLKVTIRSAQHLLSVKPGDSQEIRAETLFHLNKFSGHLPYHERKEFVENMGIFFEPPGSGINWNTNLYKYNHLLPYNYKNPEFVFIKFPEIENEIVPIHIDEDGLTSAIMLRAPDGQALGVNIFKKSIHFPVDNINLRLARNSFKKHIEIQVQNEASQRAQLLASSLSVPQKSAYARAKERRDRKSGKRSPTNEQLEFGVGPKEDSVESRKAAQDLVVDLANKQAADIMKKKKPKKKKKKKKKSKSQSPTELGDPPKIASMKDVELDITDNLKVSAAQEKEEMYDLENSIFKQFKHNNNSKIWNFLLVHLQKLMKGNLNDSFVIISGGMATFLHTNGIYPTEDLDIKIYPKNERLASWNYKEFAKQIFEMVKDFLRDTQIELLEDLKKYLNMNNVIQISAKLIREDTIKISFQIQEILEASPEKPVEYKGMLYASNTTINRWVAYCDIGIWKHWNIHERIESEKKFLEEVLPRNKRNINEIPDILERFEPKNVHDVVIDKLQKDGKDYHSFGGIHTPPNSFTYNQITTVFPIVNRDYLLYEKRELVRDIKDKTYNYNNPEFVWDQKVDRWETQTRLLILDKAVKKGGKRKTRRRKKRKTRRRKKTRRTRRKSRRR
jgi:hypothetical protein